MSTIRSNTPVNISINESTPQFTVSASKIVFNQTIDASNVSLTASLISTNNIIVTNGITLNPTPSTVNVSSITGTSLNLTGITSAEILIIGTGNFSINSINNYNSLANFKIRLNNTGSGSFIPGGNIALNGNLALTLYGASGDWIELFYKSNTGKYYQYDVGDYS